MEYRRLGRTDLKVSSLGWARSTSRNRVRMWSGSWHRAIDAGVNYLDLFFWEQLGSIVNPHRDDFILAAHWKA